MSPLSSCRLLRLTATIAAGLLALPVLAYHPLATEDTDTIGAGRQQFELSLDRARGTGRSRSDQLNLIYTYGLAAKLDLQIGAPQLRRLSDDGTGGVASARGAGDARVDLKWQAFASDGFTFGVKPGLSFATGDADRGLGRGRANWGAILMAGYETGALEIYGHLGAQRNRNTAGERNSLYQVSVATLYESAERLWLTAEAGVTRQPDPTQPRNPVFWLVGVIWGPTKDLDLDIGWRRTRHDPGARRTLGLGATVRW